MWLVQTFILNQQRSHKIRKRNIIWADVVQVPPPPQQDAWQYLLRDPPCMAHAKVIQTPHPQFQIQTFHLQIQGNAETANLLWQVFQRQNMLFCRCPAEQHIQQLLSRCPYVHGTNTSRNCGDIVARLKVTTVFALRDEMVTGSLLESRSPYRLMLKYEKVLKDK